MLFKQFNFDGCLSYITACDTEMVGAIIDPSHEKEPYLQYIKENNLKILYVIDTHTHVDHVSFSPELADMLGAKTVMNDNVSRQREIGLGAKDLVTIGKIISENSTKRVDIYLKEGERLQMGGVFLEALYTPGHTQDSMSLLSNGRVYTGDTLFIGQCGRTDLPGGSSEDMYNSLFNKLLKLPDDIVIYPAHDYKGNINSSMGYERVNNVCVKSTRTVEEFGAFLKSLFPPLDVDGGKLQCGLVMDNEPAVNDEDRLSPLMKSFCISMEQYLQEHHEATQITPQELIVKINDGEKLLLLDVREPEELAENGFISGSVNIPIREVSRRVGELPKDFNYPIVVICRSGLRSAVAALYLRGYGYTNVKNLEYGIREWKAQGYPLEFPH